jgi:hypothetical protein
MEKVCDKHSGTCSEIDHLREFQKNQTGPEGINAQLFERCNDIRTDIQGFKGEVKGSVRTAVFIISAIVTLFCGGLAYMLHDVKSSVQNQLSKAHAAPYLPDSIGPNTAHALPNNNLIPKEGDLK